jgi:asparagine synthase (glutamine-hydrolysing)
VWHQDEPYSGASVFSQWEVMKRARERGIKVLLTGQGGDEILAGYYKYYPYLLLDLVRNARLGAFFDNFAWLSARNGYTKGDALRSMVMIIASSMLPPSLKSRVKSILRKRPPFLTADFFERNGRDEIVPPRTPARSLLDRELLDSITISPLPGLLHIDDRNSMAHSIESRPPFLDHRLVEFLFSLPSDAKISHGYTKFILREALKGLLPEKIRLRRDKMGFVTPAKVWFRNELKDVVVDILRSEECKGRGIFDSRGVEGVLDSHFKGHADSSFTIWSWMNLELWFRVCVERTSDDH